MANEDSGLTTGDQMRGDVEMGADHVAEALHMLSDLIGDAPGGHLNPTGLGFLLRIVAEKARSVHADAVRLPSYATLPA